MLLKQIASKCIYVEVVIAVRDIIDCLFSISTDTKQMYNIICYHELSSAYIQLFNNQIDSDNKNYYVIQYDDKLNYIRYITNLAQLRVLGELEFYNWEKYDGWASGIMNALINLKDVESNINTQLSDLQTISKLLDLKLSSNIKYKISEY